MRTELWFWCRMARMAVGMAVLILYGVSTGIAMNCAKPSVNGFLPLDDAPNSVDDMYNGCKDKMKSKVQTEYLANKKNGDSRFKQAWLEGENYDNKKRSNKKGRQSTKALGKEQAVAIYVYTLDNPKIYPDFNEAVRTQKHEYKTRFRYHTLNFFLTDALQTLNTRKREEERNITVYRRVNSYFRQDILNKEIRFGSFTSSSMDRYASDITFGDKSCFEIITCLGADISLFSKLGESEGEVLIPPYEVFKVTNTERRSDQKTLPCEVVYYLESTGKAISNLNCALLK
ncbi:LOW QUALITY PROTEIN: GPI-linked NAD(P)(+)--arginine ADP-ribosyltransferase 1-like [Eleginops maclovinus]|uniref:LOW QUALITY PROTEIN: GPI-linked NAD(P)(+)--arginine ADP-ribosyltransferase 1-like n=1 Tax=Eleginops maclovinus TaxID=56733 RepID=UPI003080AF6A